MAAKTVHAYTGAAYVAASPRKASASAIKRIFSPFTTNIWVGLGNAVTSVSASNTATGTWPNRTSNVTVSWVNPDTSLTSYYDVYYDVNSSGNFIKHNSATVSKSSTSYTFGSIPAATNYRWFIRTVALSGLTTDSSTTGVFSLAAPVSRPLSANTGVLTNGVSWTATAGVYQRFYLYYSSNNSTWTGPIEVSSATTQTTWGYQITTAESVNRYWRVLGQNTNAHWSPEATLTVLTPVDCRQLGTTNGWTASAPVANAATGTCGNRTYTTTTTFTKTGCTTYTTTSAPIAAADCNSACYDETTNTGSQACGCSGTQTTSYVSYAAKAGSNCGAKANSGTTLGSCTGDCAVSDADCYTSAAVNCDGCGSATSYSARAGASYGGGTCGAASNSGACGTWQLLSPYGGNQDNFLGDGVNWDAGYAPIGCYGFVPSNNFWCSYPDSINIYDLYQCSNTGARKVVYIGCCIPSCC